MDTPIMEGLQDAPASVAPPALVLAPACATATHARARSRNLIEPLLARGARPADCAALHFDVDGLQSVSWGRVVERVRAVSEALVALGVAPGDRVCLFAETRLDGCVADLAVLGARAVTVPLCPSSTASELEHALRDSGARLAFVDGEATEGAAAGRWSRLRAAMERLPELQQVIAFDLPSDPAAGVLSLADLEASGRALLGERPGGLEERSAALGPDDVASICYTPGTTGQAKGVLLTHGNWTAQARAIPQIGLMSQDDVVLLFLPLAHAFGKVVQAAWLDQGFPLAFARSARTALEDAEMVRATAMPVEPRLLEKVFARVVGDGSALPGARGWIFRWAMAELDRCATAHPEGRGHRSVRWWLARRLVKRVGAGLRARLGGRMKAFVSGNAPLTRRLSLFFEECGLPVLEGYGLTETAAPTHANRLGAHRPGTVGLPFPGVETRIAADGEILLRGPQVMKGYHGLPALTAKVLDDDGWLRTGDVGEVDADGFLRVTDRKQDLIRTGDGKIVAPRQLEQALSALPLVGHAVVIGDGRRFVSALLTIAPEEAARWAAEVGLPELPYEMLVCSVALGERLRAGVAAINDGLPAHAQVKKFAILDRELSVEEGELTPKLTIRREIIVERHRALIDELYDEPGLR